MPFSLDPQPAENEIECANCGALIYYELTRCPNCGVNLYEPEERPEEDHRVDNRRGSPKNGTFEKVRTFFRRLVGKPSAAEELFGASLQRYTELYDDLLRKAGGDDEVVERLFEYERSLQPEATQTTLLEKAIQRWERDNRSYGVMDDNR
jgi:predicted  nucleic acid-binding Zn-ribbon protein